MSLAWVEWACALETTYRTIVFIVVGGIPGRWLVPYGIGLIVLLMVAGTGTCRPRCVVAGRGRATAHRNDQTECDGRDVESHNNIIQVQQYSRNRRRALVEVLGTSGQGATN